MRPRLALLLVVVLIPAPIHAQRAAGAAAKSLAEGLGKLADERRAQASEKERLANERLMAEAYANLANAQAEAARTATSRPGRPLDAIAAPTAQTVRAAYDLLVEAIYEEYKATPEYETAVRRYASLKSTAGDSAATRFWDTVQAAASRYALRRWIEIAPRQVP